MRQGYYQFELGEFKCTIVNDWRGAQVSATASIRSSLSNATEEELQSVFQTYSVESDDKKEVFVNCLLLDTGSKLILFDVGMGTPHLFPDSGKVRPDLQSAGIHAEDIDLVILTHGHWDHVAGLTDGAGNLLFPNAKYMMQRDEWTFWTNPDNLAIMHPAYAKYDRLPFDRLPLIADKTHLFDFEEELLPGISAIPAGGHTPGHSAFLIASGGEQLLHISDLIHHDLHFEYPNFHHEVDIQPALSLESRGRIFAKAAKENLLVLGCHTGPRSGLGRIEQKGEAWRWTPA